MPVPDPVIAVIREWLRKADNDLLNAAEWAGIRPSPDPGVIPQGTAPVRSGSGVTLVSSAARLWRAAWPFLLPYPTRDDWSAGNPSR